MTHAYMDTLGLSYTETTTIADLLNPMNLDFKQTKPNYTKIIIYICFT